MSSNQIISNLKREANRLRKRTKVWADLGPLVKQYDGRPAEEFRKKVGDFYPEYVNSISHHGNLVYIDLDMDIWLRIGMFHNGKTVVSYDEFSRYNPTEDLAKAVTAEDMANEEIINQMLENRDRLMESIREFNNLVGKTETTSNYYICTEGPTAL